MQRLPGLRAEGPGAGGGWGGGRTGDAMACGAQYEKRLIRERARLTVAGLSASERSAASAQVCRRVVDLEAWQQAHTVMLFLPIPGEPDITTLESSAFEAGKRVALPRMDWQTRRIAPIEVAGPGYATEVRHYGVVEPLPNPSAELTLERIDLVVTPGIAFDRQGRRVGRGAGFYDRFLDEWRKAKQLPGRSVSGGEAGGTVKGGTVRGEVVGVCFAAQLVERAPREPHDALVDVVVWESGVVMCRTTDGIADRERQ